jgi:hypothetical protein
VDSDAIKPERGHAIFLLRFSPRTKRGNSHGEPMLMLLIPNDGARSAIWSRSMIPSEDFAKVGFEFCDLRRYAVASGKVGSPAFHLIFSEWLSALDSVLSRGKLRRHEIGAA